MLSHTRLAELVAFVVVTAALGWAGARLRSRRSSSLLVLTLGFAAVWLALALYGGSSVYRAYQRGVFGGRSLAEPAPEVRTVDANGERVDLRDYRNKVVLLDFWASWCPPCRKARPMIGRLHEKYAAEGLAIVGVSGDEDESAWRAFLSQHASEWPESRDPAVWKTFGVGGVPYYVLIDRKGLIRNRLQPAAGDDGDRELEAKIRKLLSE